MNFRMLAFFIFFLFSINNDICFGKIESLTVDSDFYRDEYGYRFTQIIKDRLTALENRNSPHDFLTRKDISINIISKRELSVYLKTTGTKGTHKIIDGSLLEYLETHGLSHTLIIKCVMKKKKFINCGLYYFNRDKRKITAQVKRVFIVPISDPTIWASRLINSLIQKANSFKKEKTKRLLKKIGNDHLARKSALDQIGFYTLTSASLRKATVHHIGHSSIKNILYGGIEGGFILSDHSIGLRYSEGQYRASSQETLRYKESLTALYHSVQYQAPGSLVWSYHTGLGLQKITADYHNGPGENVSLTQKWMMLASGPGMGIDLTDQMRLSHHIMSNWQSKSSSRIEGLLAPQPQQVGETHKQYFSYQLTLKYDF